MPVKVKVPAQPPRVATQQESDFLDNLPIHYQVKNVRKAALAVYDGMQRIPDTVDLSIPQNNQQLKLADAVMPVNITVNTTVFQQYYQSHYGHHAGAPQNAWATPLEQIQTPFTLKLFSRVTMDAVLPLVTPPKRTQELEFTVLGDETFILLADLVQRPVGVKKISLSSKSSAQSMQALRLGQPTVSAQAFSDLLGALCKVPATSQLQVVVIPADVRNLVTGDPIITSDAMVESKGHPVASRILKYAPTSIPPPVIAAVDEEDIVTLWLSARSTDAFVEESSVRFSRERLLANSGLIHALLNDNPGEDHVELPFYKMKQRSVSLDALRITSQLVQHCTAAPAQTHAPAHKRKPKGGDKKVTAPEPFQNGDKPVWTIEFEEVFCNAFLPALDESDVPAFRRQQALKLFGEILELGLYLELRVAYEFGLVGGVGVFARRINTDTGLGAAEEAAPAAHVDPGYDNYY